MAARGEDRLVKRRAEVEQDGYECRQVGLSNPEADPAVAADLPRLLRRTADLIEELDIAPMELLDVVVSS